MEFSWTGEISANLGTKYRKVASYIESEFDRSSSLSGLNKIDVKVHFCPILMDKDLAKYYPPRSEVDIDDGVLHSARQLDYQAFKEGEFSDQLRICIDSITSDTHLLRKLGLDDEQIEAVNTCFEQIERSYQDGNEQL